MPDFSEPQSRLDSTLKEQLRIQYTLCVCGKDDPQVVVYDGKLFIRDTDTKEVRVYPV